MRLFRHLTLYMALALGANAAFAADVATLAALRAASLNPLARHSQPPPAPHAEFLRSNDGRPHRQNHFHAQTHPLHVCAHRRTP